MKCHIDDIVEYECASCHEYFQAPISHFGGFIASVRLAASMGHIGNHFDITKVPTVNACCPDCFKRLR